MTNKEQYLKEAINRIKYYNTDEPLKIVNVPLYTEEINALCDYFKQPTLSECIKEWNEKGFDVDVYALEIVIHNYNTVDKEEDEIEISIRLDKKTIFYVNDVELSFDLHHLLSKTIKALEEMKDE